MRLIYTCAFLNTSISGAPSRPWTSLTSTRVRTLLFSSSLALSASCRTIGALSAWRMLTCFFDSVLDAIRAGDHARVNGLLRGPLSESDETHLGWSKGASRGRSVGGKRADLIIASLEKSKAARTGLLQDLEDSALFIERIGPDIISDITTNVCKGKLLAYAQSAAARHGIPLEEVPSACWRGRIVERSDPLPFAM